MYENETNISLSLLDKRLKWTSTLSVIQIAMIKHIDLVHRENEIERFS